MFAAVAYHVGVPLAGDLRMKARFDELYARHGPELLRYLRRLTGSMEDAGDLLQETFLRLWEQPAPEDIENVRAWLFRVAANLAQNQRRSEQRLRRRERASIDVADPVSSSEEQLEARRRVEKALASVDDRGRRVLLLFAEGFTYREIAAITGIEPGYVGVLMQRARAEFRRRVEGVHAEPVPFKRRLS